MALDPFISILFFAQLIAVAVLILRNFLSHGWAEAFGLLLGVVIGTAPFLMGLGPATFTPTFLMTITAAIVLVIVFGAARQWIAFAVALIFTSLIGALHEVSGLFAPIICALACRKILELLCPFGTLRRSA